MENTKEKMDVYQIVTNKILEQLEMGVVPWIKEWRDAGIPKNLLTGKVYRGINLLLLASCNYHQNYFLTLNQVKSLGGRVKEEEFRKYHLVVYSKRETKVDRILEQEYVVSILRYYKVYNVNQCINLPLEKYIHQEVQTNNYIDICDQIIAEMPTPPSIEYGGAKAYYDSRKDHVQMPPIQVFYSSEFFYGTLFHELIHSTGHKSRLARKELLTENWNEHLYSIEELTAEIGACNLSAIAGIAPPELTNSVAYIQGWFKRLQFDKKLIVYAASQAQKACDFILNKIEFNNNQTQNS
jgi:antirestriction protein ArdC